MMTDEEYNKLTTINSVGGLSGTQKTEYDAETKRRQKEALEAAGVSGTNYRAGTTTTTPDLTTRSKSHATQRGSSSSVGQQQTVSQKQMGQWSPDALGRAQYVESQYKPYERAVGRLADVIGANLEKTKKQRENEILEAKKRAKWAEVVDSVGVLSDIIAGGIGGNVYKREPNGIAKESAETARKYKELQAAEEAQAAQQLAQLNLAKAEKLAGIQQAWDTATGAQVSTGRTMQNGNTFQQSDTRGQQHQTGTNTSTFTPNDGTTNSGTAATVVGQPQVVQPSWFQQWGIPANIPQVGTFHIPS